MRRRPRRRPPTIQELFLSFCFCVLAVSIAWNILPREAIRDFARNIQQEGIRTVQFPADTEPSGAIRAALAEHAARTGRSKVTSAVVVAPAPSDDKDDEAGPARSWGTALFGR